MAIEELSIDCFRNLRHVKLSPSPATNLIIGSNGSGKTSLLEAIYFLGTARSFRTPHAKLLINCDATEFTLYSKIRKGDVTIGVGITRELKQAKIKIGGQHIYNASQLAELLPVQLINPDIHRLMEEGPRYRRRFIEWGVFHVKPNYLSVWQHCIHILRQRNAALRQAVTLKELNYWDGALTEVSEQVTKLRMDYLEALQPYIDQLLSGVTGLPPITIHLDRGWPTENSLLQMLKQSRDIDQKRGFTQHGPHRADLRILTGTRRAKDVVSRGQQKLITALMKLAQLKHLIESQPGSAPVLLVDDLPAELDWEFRGIIMREIAAISVQNFITATEITNLPVSCLEPGYQMFHVKHGEVVSE